MSYEIHNPELEQTLKEIGHKLGAKLPPGYGFTLLLFGYNNHDMFYISSAQRAGMMRAMREFIQKFQEN